MAIIHMTTLGLMTSCDGGGQPEVRAKETTLCLMLLMKGCRQENKSQGLQPERSVTECMMTGADESGWRG